MSSPAPAAATPPSPLTTGAIAGMVGAELVGPADLAITSLEALDRAGPGGLTFIRSERFAAAWAGSGATAALVTRRIAVPGHDPARRALLLVDDADIALARLLGRFAPPAHQPERAIHPTAVVDPTAQVGAGVAIGPMCIVGPRTVVGEGTVLHAQVYLGADVRVGSRTTIHPQVRILDRCTVGDGCILWPGVSIGADGFGFVPAPGGRGLVKIPHIGHVEVGHHVEIGANSCIDRGKFGPTTVGDGTKIDNLVQIGHNDVIGRSVIICGHSGLAGSVTVGDGVLIGGHVGIADNLTIGPLARISAKAGVMNDVPAGQTWGGYPARPHLEWMRAHSALLQLSDHLRELKRATRAAKGEAGK